MLGSGHSHRLMMRRVARLLLSLLAVSACKLDEKPGGGGGLIVAIDTDMAMPKDLDAVRLEVTHGGTMLFEHEQALSEGTKALPLEFQVPDPKDNTPVFIRALGIKDGAVRVERSAITPVPTSYLGFVRLMLNYLCDGMVAENGQSTCEPAFTCVQGTCESADITDALPDYYKRDVANPDMSQSPATACFDVAKCFSMATEMMPDPTDGCSFKSTKLFATGVNVALRLEPGSPGVCTQTACWIVLDSDGGGFTVGNDDRVFLPEYICQQRSQGVNLRVAMSMQCGSKTQSQPLCRGDDASSMEEDPSRPVGPGVGTPPVSDACAGGGVQACEMCGSQARMCQSGLWSQFGECGAQGVCTPELMEPCGVNGMRTCGGDCTWGDCENQTCDGPATRACGFCGTQHRSCNNGVWSEWLPCGDEGVCMPGTTQACGSGGTQACQGSCQWSPCTMQVCDGAASNACGNCGMQTRTCDSNTAQWSEWGACEDQGVCRPDSTMVCGREGTQTCGGNCRWDVACTGQTCEGPSRRACGLCGTQTRSCNMMTGEYSDWSACFGEGECMPNARMACGSGGEQTCGGNCRWGTACTGQTCTGPSTQRCGDCGTQTRTCNTNTGEWSGWGTCADEGDCTAGETRTCGANMSGTQTCTAACRWDAACPGQMCDGPATRACQGNPCAMQTRTCNMNTGAWGQWSACPTGCVPGATDTMGCMANAQRTCTQMCTMGSCACNSGLMQCPGSTVCRDLMTDVDNCGRCGNACADGLECSAGRCVCSGAAEECPAGSGVCVNTQTNGQNCGECGNACVGGMMCMGGDCACPSMETFCTATNTCVNFSNDAMNCGGCGNRCTTARPSCVGGMCRCGGSAPDDCSGTCTNIQSDRNNCGGCNVRCVGEEMCNGGRCMLDCPPWQTPCGGQCVNTNTSGQHCGECNNACMVRDAQCQNGDCGCPPGTEDCGGSCVATNTNMRCGSCTNSCTGTTTCSMAPPYTCVCGGTTPNDCGGTCTNTQTDRNNCGGCNMPCPTGASCSAGSCDCAGEDLLCPPSGPNQACVDSITDPNNCGACGVSCGGRACEGGLCACPPGERRCLPNIACQAPSVNSCGSSCQPCGLLAGATAIECTAGGECVYACNDDRPLCGRGCCTATEQCVDNTCQEIVIN
jgi:hypothetical protein